MDQMEVETDREGFDVGSIYWGILKLEVQYPLSR